MTNQYLPLKYCTCNTNNKNIKYQNIYKNKCNKCSNKMECSLFDSYSWSKIVNKSNNYCSCTYPWNSTCTSFSPINLCSTQVPINYNCSDTNYIPVNLQEELKLFYDSGFKWLDLKTPLKINIIEAYYSPKIKSEWDKFGQIIYIKKWSMTPYKLC